MERFWNAHNVERLRRLSCPLIEDDERDLLLRELGREMDNFRKEMREICAARAMADRQPMMHA